MKASNLRKKSNKGKEQLPGWLLLDLQGAADRGLNKWTVEKEELKDYHVNLLRKLGYTVIEKSSRICSILLMSDCTTYEINW